MRRERLHWKSPLPGKCEGKALYSKFAKSLDRVQPVLLHAATGGVVWQEFGTTEPQVRAQMKAVRENTPALWPAVNAIIEKAATAGRLRPGPSIHQGKAKV